MDKSIVKKYTIVGWDDWDTRIYNHLQNTNDNNYYSVMIANIKSVEVLSLVRDKHIGIGTGKFSYEGYIHIMGSVYDEVEHDYSIIIKDEIKKVFCDVL